ncbi:hypothetical protein C8J56DRAFT_740679, partial [Mycena floridula]
QRLESLAVDKKRLENLPVQIREECRVLYETIFSRKALLSPARQLPSEIISNILIHASSEQWNLFRMKEIPWVAGRVFGMWRDTALSLPEL